MNVIDSSNTGTLIIGNCQAGVQLATSLREHGNADPIVLIGEEPHAPYQRPPLSKGFLKGESTTADCVFRTPEWYTGQGIEVVVQERITSISRDASGGVALSDSGRRFPFDRLALTTGAAARRLPLEGAELDGVGYLRDAVDAVRLHAQLERSRNVVVIGGGFIGLEIAAGARASGKDVTVLEAAPRLVGRAVSELTSEFYLQAHRRRGTHVVLNAKITRLIGQDNHVTGVVLHDGTVVPADVVVIGIGVTPRTELAEQLGLTVDNGIVVDERCLASDGLTVAAGDCANVPVPCPTGSREGRVRLESVPNAIEQAKVAAKALLGLPGSYRTVPWFWSEQADLKLQIAGLSQGHDQVLLRGDPTSEKCSILYYRHDRIIAADCINSPKDFTAVRNVLGKGQNINARQAADPTVALKDLAETTVLIS